jgi:pyruvate formate-lyase activating enzyme-like uncharacterized protein
MVKGKIMLTKYDLYDLSAVFKNIRFDIKYENNIQITEQLIYTLKQQTETDTQNIHTTQNEIRKSLSVIQELPPEKWAFIFHNNLYVNCEILKDEKIYKLLIALLEELRILFINNQFDKAYDLLDCIHNLPQDIANNKFQIPSMFWNDINKCQLKHRIFMIFQTINR